MTYTTDLVAIIDEDDMLSDTTDAVPTQQSVKAYVDASLVTSDGYTYITQTAHAALTGSQNLAALTTGMLSSTTSTGVVVNRTLTGTANQLDIANGDGSGVPTFSASSTFIFPGTATLGGNLDVTGHSIVTTSNGNVTINPDGVGAIDLSSDIVLVGQDIQHDGDTNNKIVFGTDTQSLETGGTSRIDISDSGVRFGGANSRITTTLDEDTMSSDSDTALATQQSIKAYVDAQIAASAAAAFKPIPSGRYLFPAGNTGDGGSTNYTTDELGFSPVYLNANAYDRIGVHVQASGTAGDAVKIGIYSSGTDGLPETLVLDGGALDCATDGAKEATISYTPSAPGWYFFAVLAFADTNLSLKVMNSSVGIDEWSLGLGAPTTTGNVANHLTDTRTYASGLESTYTGSPTYQTDDTIRVVLRRT